MAKQMGVIQISGKIGNIVMFQRDGKYFARQQSSLNAKRVLTDPAFARSRESSAEFGRGGHTASLLRHAVKRCIPLAGNGRTHARLTREMIKVIGADSVSRRGERKPLVENYQLLHGFEWNDNYLVRRNLSASYETAVNGTSASLTIAELNPVKNLNWPEHATHVVISIVGLQPGFEQGNCTSVIASSELIARTDTLINLQLETTISSDPYFLGISIQFFEMVGGRPEPLMSNQGFCVVASGEARVIPQSKKATAQSATNDTGAQLVLGF